MREAEQGYFHETSLSLPCRRPSGGWLCTQCPSSRHTRGQQAKRLRARLLTPKGHLPEEVLHACGAWGGGLCANWKKGSQEKRSDSHSICLSRKQRAVSTVGLIPQRARALPLTSSTISAVLPGEVP